MVSDKVEVFTKSYREEARAVRWECDGSPEYILEETEKEERGTSIVMHLNDESQEFLDADRVGKVLEKFCKFLPVPIFFEEKQINNTYPAWTKKPAELNDGELPEFLQGIISI